MKRILSLAVACASVVAISPSASAKPDKHNGNGNGGQVQMQARGGGGNVHQGGFQAQARSGGNFGRVQPSRPSMQTQRYSAPTIQRSSPSVALTGRTRADNSATYNQRLQQQQLVQRREKWRENLNDRGDRHDGDHNRNWSSRGYSVPYSVHHDWDHNRIHEWNNHRWRWYNNAWVIIDPGFGYGYDYDYYDSPTVVYSDSGGSLAARVQVELAREGYDPGPADGVIGPATRDAIVDFQRDHDLPVTGRIDNPLLRELGL